jgi:ATP-binding cassette subfamily F protein uup
MLVLDEPTNDLDIPTLEVLEEAIETFPGATLLVTHDRAMLEALATRIVVLGVPDGGPRVVASLTQALRALDESERAAMGAPMQQQKEAQQQKESQQQNSAQQQKTAPAPAVPAAPALPSASRVQPPAPAPAAPQAAKKKLSYNEQRELEGMEAAIAAAERKHADLDAKLNEPKLVADRAAYAKACDAAGAAQAEIVRLYSRWQELEAKRG